MTQGEQRTLAELRDDPTVKDYLKKIATAEQAIEDEVKEHKPGPEEEDRAQVLEDAVDFLVQARDEWSNSEADSLAPDDRFGLLIEDVLMMFLGGMVPASCRKLAELVLVMLQPWQAFVQKLELTGEENGMPGPEFWRAFETIDHHRSAVTIARPNNLEPISTLITQGVSERQICEIYGFGERIEKSNGTVRFSPDMDMLREEMATPGKHTGSGTGWMSPMEAKSRAELDAARRAGKRVVGELRSSREKRNAAETVVELAEQDVSLKQMSEMKGIPVEEISKQLEEAGMRVPPLKYDPVETARSPLEHDLTEDEKRRLEAAVGPDIPVQKARRRRSATIKSPAVREFVLEQHEKGMDPRQITRAIKQEFNNLKIHGNVVRAMIQRAIKEKETETERKRILVPKPLPPDMPPMTFTAPGEEMAAIPVPEGVPGGQGNK